MVCRVNFYPKQADRLFLCSSRPATAHATLPDAVSSPRESAVCPFRSVCRPRGGRPHPAAPLGLRRIWEVWNIYFKINQNDFSPTCATFYIFLSTLMQKCFPSKWINLWDYKIESIKFFIFKIINTIRVLPVDNMLPLVLLAGMNSSDENPVSIEEVEIAPALRQVDFIRGIGSLGSLQGGLSNI